MRKNSKFKLGLGIACLSTNALASDFNIPFVNSSSLGVAYADWASAASDASTTFTNPAGLVKIPKAQIMGNLLGIFGTARFTGTAMTPTTPFPFPIIESGVATTQIGAFSPSLFFASPILDRISFGVGVTAPFALGTNYGLTSIARHAATRSQVLALDIAPSLAFKVADSLSVGFGVDAVNLSFTLNNMYGPPLSFPVESELQNHLSGWGYSWHAGILYQLLKTTRLGFSYNAKISIDTLGDSIVFGGNGIVNKTNYQETKAALPARAQFSIQHDITDRWTGMATAFYTNWRTFKQITMERTMTPFGFVTPVTIPFNYHNCFDYSVGAAFKANEKWTLRGGVQFLSTPSNDYDRGIADPVGSATIATIGAHFQQNESLSYDIGVGHSFFKQMPVNFTNPLTSLSGHTNTQTSVLGGQINWYIS